MSPTLNSGKGTQGLVSQAEFRKQLKVFVFLSAHLSAQNLDIRLVHFQYFLIFHMNNCCVFMYVHVPMCVWYLQRSEGT